MKRYDAFPSFHGPDVRQGFLSLLHTHFAIKGSTTLTDQSIGRGHTIGPERIQAIRESTVSIVMLSKKYASSSWRLDELVEILKCKEDFGQIVIPIFYEVDPSDVRKQRGDFGSAFEKTCQGKSEEVKQRWSKALADVATIAGEHSLNWYNEAEMIQKVATDVSKKLNVTPSRGFKGMVGLEAHLNKLDSLLCVESDEVKIIGIWGPAGIGKSTIARALFNQVSSSFKLRCFMGNLKGSYKSTMGVDDYDSKLSLQNQLLSKILNQGDMRVHHLGSIKKWLQYQRVLIVLDDVDDLEQLEALAKEPSLFGSGSLIIVTTKDKTILKAHGIHDIYHVDFPSKKEAIEILCLSAFNQSSVPKDFEQLANKVAKLCGDLPLGLCVVGSSLRGESKHEWEHQLSRLETCLDRNIEQVLRVEYEKLSKNEQSLFLRIALLFNNNEIVDHVATMLGGSNLDVTNGLNTLASKSLVHISTNGRIVMHCLLQQLGRQIVLEQSNEPGRHQLLEEVEQIHNVLENETGTGPVIGISFDTSKIGNRSKFSTSGRTPSWHPWRRPLDSFTQSVGLVFNEMRNGLQFITSIPEQVTNLVTWISLKKCDWRPGILWDTDSDRNPKEAEIVQPDENSRRDDDGLSPSKDDNFLVEANSHSTVVELPPNHQILRYGFLSHLVKVVESYIILILLGMIIGCLLLLSFCLAYMMSTPLTGEGGAINGIVENVPKVLEYVPTERTENPRDKYTEFPRGEFRAKPESSSSDAKTNADLLDRTCSCSPMDGKVKPPNIQVFINFRGNLRYNFIGHLVKALRRSEINVFIDTDEQRGEDLDTLFKRIEDSGIAIVVFSSWYTESEWCLNELVKIKERVLQRQLKVLPIYYKVTPTNVKRLKGEFGDHFRDKEYMYASEEPKIKQWKEAIAFVSHRFLLAYDEKSTVWEIDFIETIVKEVLKMLQAISTVESGQAESQF